MESMYSSKFSRRVKQTYLTNVLFRPVFLFQQCGGSSPPFFPSLPEKRELRAHTHTESDFFEWKPRTWTAAVARARLLILFHPLFFHLFLALLLCSYFFHPRLCLSRRPSLCSSYCRWPAFSLGGYRTVVGSPPPPRGSIEFWTVVIRLSRGVCVSLARRRRTPSPVYTERERELCGVSGILSVRRGRIVEMRERRFLQRCECSAAHV